MWNAPRGGFLAEGHRVDAQKRGGLFDCQHITFHALALYLCTSAAHPSENAWFVPNPASTVPE
jgi:hypothetical protein